jgi:2-dehydropantoate 2-reductase
MKILVLGAGAVGGYFGGRLAEAGGDVTFLVRPRRAEIMAASGLIVKSAFGDISQPAKTVTGKDIGGPYDLVLLTCKSYDLDAAMDAVEPAMGPETKLVPLLNGLSHMEALDKRFGAGRVLGGSCHLAATLTEDGEIHHLNQLQALTLGERSGAPSPIAQAIADMMAESPAKIIVSDVITQQMWEKFVMLTALASTTCLMRASVGDIMATGAGEEIATSILDECISVAEASGHRPREKPESQARGLLTDAGSSMTASMLRDIENGAPTEADHIVGDMLARAKAAGIPAPNLNIAYCHLQAYENRRVGTR